MFDYKGLYARLLYRIVNKEVEIFEIGLESLSVVFIHLLFLHDTEYLHCFEAKVFLVNPKQIINLKKAILAWIKHMKWMLLSSHLFSTLINSVDFRSVISFDNFILLFSGDRLSHTEYKSNIQFKVNNQRI